MIIPACSACGSKRTRAHCDRRDCGWWRCVECRAYGDRHGHLRGPGAS